ncbi:MAG: hypothetical protein FWE28_08250 [Oscillospiraceae bacterium]|nr:hypothetical protein [Oscillospiraceae bacterium]
MLATGVTYQKYGCLGIYKGGTTALDHWGFKYYYIRPEGFGTSAGYKMRNRRHSALDLCGYIGA